MKPRNEFAAGVTLIELLVTIVIIAIVATIAFPSLQNQVRQNRVSAQANELGATIAYARSQAMLGIPQIELELESLANSWNAFLTTTDACTGDGCVLRSLSHTNVSLDSSRSIGFDNRGIVISGPATIRLEHVPCSGPRQTRLIEVFVSGQVNIEVGNCGG